MPSHKETRVLPYTAEQLYDLVIDIEQYPEFVPWCMAARVNSQAKNSLEADVIVGYKIYREKFTSRVHMIRPNAIEVEYLKGPMKHLQNKWIFTDLRGKKCEVDFYVDFSLKTRMFESLVDQFFHRALVRMIDAFEKRAEDLYG